MGTVLYPFPERQGYLCTKSINLGTQPFLEYVIVKKMSLAIIPETEFELTRTCSFALWTCVSPINPTRFAVNCAVQVYLLLQELLEKRS